MSETTRTEGPRFCRSCGAQADPEAAFCRSCGARLRQAQPPPGPEPQPEPQPESESQPQPQSEPATVDRVSESLRRHVGTLSSRIPEPARRYLDALPSRLTGEGRGAPGGGAWTGAALGVGCAVGLVVAVYVFLLLRGTFQTPYVPKNIGLVIFGLLHGGSAAVETPPIAALSLPAGSMNIDLPVTSFAVVPFAAAFLAGRGVARRTRVSWGFAAAAAATYALMVAVFSALGSVPLGTGDFAVLMRADSLPAAAWGAFLVGGGAAIGVSSIAGFRSATRFRNVFRVADLLGPTPRTHLRQAVQGATLAAAVGLVPVSALAVLDIAACGYGSLLGEATNGTGACEGRGVLVALLPTVVGGMWLLGHGLPVGFRIEPDLGDVPLLGEYLSGLPSSFSLLGNWPLGDGWRLLVVVPVLSVLLGGMVSARGVHARDRFFQGALVCVPYVAVAVLVNALVGITASASVAGFDLEIALRVALPWMLVLLVVTALVGGLGGLLASPDRIEALRSRLPSRLLRYLHRPEKRAA